MNEQEEKDCHCGCEQLWWILPLVWTICLIIVFFISVGLLASLAWLGIPEYITIWPIVGTILITACYTPPDRHVTQYRRL